MGEPDIQVAVVHDQNFLHLTRSLRPGNGKRQSHRQVQECM
jgi:hypothetical protein